MKQSSSQPRSMRATHWQTTAGVRAHQQSLDQSHHQGGSMAVAKSSSMSYKCGLS